MLISPISHSSTMYEYIYIYIYMYMYMYTETDDGQIDR
jgi:hypothetical protein